MEGSTAAVKPKAKLKGNKKEEKDKNPKGKVAKGKGKEVVLNCAKFEGQGLSYKAKLFGFVEVPGPRGDQSSVQAIQKLKQQAKQLKKGANEHKLKITFNITLQGVRLYNEKTQTIEHEHPIQKISFISHDPEDRHVFGYIYSPPRSAANEARKYYLFAVKSDKSADVITVQLYELFQVVYKMQENKKIKSKDSSAVKQRQHEKSSQPLEPLQNKMLLEMSNKIGGDQQQYPPDEHLYAEPTFVKRTPSEPPSDYAIPSGQPVQTSSASESNEYQVPRQENEISEREKEDIATAIALSLSVQENSQPFSDKVSTPTTNDSGFEAVFDSTMSFPTEEISNQNTFHAEFPPFENGFTSSENLGSRQGVSESSNDSDKFSIPVSDEIQMSHLNQVPFNAFGDIPSSAEVKTDLETSEIENASIDKEVVSPWQPDDVATFYSKTEDANYNSTKLELQPAEEGTKEPSLANMTIGNFSSFESESQNDSEAKNDETETSTTTEINKFVTQSSFEVNFETEDEHVIPSKQSKQDMFTFDAGTDAFSSQDPFASTGPTEFDQSAFGAFTDDDPFSPKGGSNMDTKSDPFAEIDNPFTADFSDVNTKDFEQPTEDTSNESNSENDQNSNREEDIFEEMFEAKMEGQFENETLSKGENEKEELNNIEQNQVELDLEKSSGDANTELESQEKEVIETTEEDQNLMTLPNENTTEPVEVEVANNSFILNNENPEDQHEAEQPKGSKEVNVSEGNTFDFSTNDVYVTLKTAALPSNRPQSPTEFSPPPLPPRPIIPMEPLDTIASPKIPPALPPRPTMNQPSVTETTSRKPPELPPRLDLEENGLVEKQFVDTVQETSTESFSNLQETNTESFSNDTESPMSQATFDAFDFDNIEDNSPVGKVGTPTASGFDSSDPFKDPFAGSDPFQTPIAGDPFASSTSFDRDVQQNNDNFDPFSGDDPFAMTPSFDAQASFPNLSSSDEPNNDEEKDKFEDFSTAFT